jgi:hypothetical protein
VIFCLTTLLFFLGLVAFKVPPAVILGMATWMILALCNAASDLAELALENRHAREALAAAERALAAVRLERDRLAQDLAAAREALERVKGKKGTAAPGRWVSRLLRFDLGSKPKSNGFANTTTSANGR